MINIQQLIYETEIFDEHIKSPNAFILSILERIESDKLLSSQSLKNEERNLSKEIKEYQSMHVQAEEDIRSFLKGKKQEHELSEDDIKALCDKEEKRMCCESTITDINKAMRRLYFLIRKNQELLKQLMVEYEDILVSGDDGDADTKNFFLKEAVQEFYKTINDRIQGLTKRVSDLQIQKTQLRSVLMALDSPDSEKSVVKDANGTIVSVDVEQLLKLKEMQLQLNESQREKLKSDRHLLNEAMKEIRVKLLKEGDEFVESAEQELLESTGGTVISDEDESDDDIDA